MLKNRVASTITMLDESAMSVHGKAKPISQSDLGHSSVSWKLFVCLEGPSAIDM